MLSQLKKFFSTCGCTKKVIRSSISKNKNKNKRTKTVRRTKLRGGYVYNNSKKNTKSLSVTTLGMKSTEIKSPAIKSPAIKSPAIKSPALIKSPVTTKAFQRRVQ